MAIRKRAARVTEEEKRAKNSAVESDGKNNPSTTNENCNKSSPSSQSTKDDLSLVSLIPAIIVCTFVSVAAYASSESINLAEDIIVATIRTFVQLSLLAALLSPLFRFVENHHNNVSKEATGSHILSRYSAPIMVLAYVLCFMLPLASYEASSRSKLTLRPAIDSESSSNNTVFFIVITALFTSVSTMAFVAIFLIIKPTPRYSPRHVIPLCGMLFNNSLSSISLALDILFSELQSKHRESIELMISFGSNVWAATRPSFRSVLVSSMKPQINSMNVIGLVAIPGMLTGQVLGGSSPTHAARYQIMIMCLIMGAVFLSVSISVELIIWNAFDDKGALRDDWIVDNDSLRVSQLISSLWAISTLSRSSALQEVSTNEVKAKAIPELIAVELSVDEPKSNKQQPDDNASPSFQININGSYARGTRSMAASFSIPNGTIAILRGESGVGKSTLLKTISMLNTGFTPSSSPRMSLIGKDRESFQPTRWRKQVLYVPQNGATKLHGTPESFLDFIASSHHIKHSSKASVLETLTSQMINYMEEWNVASPQSKLSQPWMQLSGGESQRILLAIAMSTEPTVLLLDEPSSALDLQAKLAVEKSLKAIAEKGCSIVLVTHDEEQMNRLGTMWLSLDAIAK
ncbi:hypothetical protein ACHAWT_000182 [Skeletonema menzelii]|eukprot:scaffold9896_cov119-Skeletonema_menzelii.AAC.2